MCLDNRKDRGRARWCLFPSELERSPGRFLEPAASVEFEGASSKNTWSVFPDAIQQTLPSQQYRACFINTGRSDVTQKTVRIFLHHWHKNWDEKMTLYPYICDQYLWLSYAIWGNISDPSADGDLFYVLFVSATKHLGLWRRVVIHTYTTNLLYLYQNIYWCFKEALWSFGKEIQTQTLRVYDIYSHKWRNKESE